MSNTMELEIQDPETDESEDSETETETETAEVPEQPTEKPSKAPVADRKATAMAAFVAAEQSATELAQLFADVPLGREHVDRSYDAAVTAVALDPDRRGEIEKHLAPINALRESVLSAMDQMGVSTKTVRVIDPAAERAALISRLQVLASIRDHLSDSAEYVADLYNELDPGDLTDDEMVAAAATFNVPEKVTTATAKIATFLTSATAPRAARTTNDGTRNPVDHSGDVPAIGTVLTRKGGKHAGRTCTVVAVPTDEHGNQLKGYGDGVGYDVNGMVHTSISAAAKAITGGSEDGWRFFGIKK